MMEAPFSLNGARGDQKGPSIELLVGFPESADSEKCVCAISSTRLSSPMMSESLCISLRVPFDVNHVCPTALRKVIPVVHSSVVNSTSRAKSWTCLNSEVKISLVRGVAPGPIELMTLGVNSGLNFEIAILKSDN